MKTGKIEEIRIEEIEEMETDTMSKLEKVFDTPNKKAFIGFLTAGDPDADSTVQFILEMEKAGADLIEIGIPFSDPTAEGVVIQEANIRSLGNVMTTDGVFEIVQRVREQSEIPLAFMTYVNPVFHYGYEKFFTKCEDIASFKFRCGYSAPVFVTVLDIHPFLQEGVDVNITLIVRLTPSNGVVGLICDNRAGSLSLLPQTPFAGYGMQQTFCTLYNLTRSRFSLVKKLLSTSLGDTDASKSRKCLVYVC
jgi:hypothetical protein